MQQTQGADRTVATDAAATDAAAPDAAATDAPASPCVGSCPYTEETTFCPSGTDPVVLPEAHFYNQPYPYVYFHTVTPRDGALPVPFAWDRSMLEFLIRFDQIFALSQYQLPACWVEYLHTLDGRHRRLFFYQLFSAAHFTLGKDRALPHEQWMVDFLDDHRADYYTINPLMPPDYQEFFPGRWASYLDYFHDYFFNFGNPAAHQYLADAFYDQRRAAWGYDGIFFDLTGSHFFSQADIQVTATAGGVRPALEQYDFLADTRNDPGATYDENGGKFLADLRAKNTDTHELPIGTNQAWRSEITGTDDNHYYREIQFDIDESTFTSWNNDAGTVTGTTAFIDGVAYTNVTLTETLTEPFFDGVAELGPMARQVSYAFSNHGNLVRGMILNYLRPYWNYGDHPGEYRPSVDRFAIYYSYATGKVVGIPAFNWDYFATILPSEGLPKMAYFRCAKDPIYFLDLGTAVTSGYETIDLGGGKVAVLRLFTKGFIIINASDPPQHITVDLSGHAGLKGAAEGALHYHDHFTHETTASTDKEFEVPASFCPLEGALKNSARVYSYLSAPETLIGGE